MEFFNDVSGDPLKPSLFELVAQEQLRDLLQPALKYVLAVFAQRYPRYLLRVVNRHEEFYAILMFFVERHYLRTQGASFSENFYGLKRRRRPLYETERAKAAVGGIPDEENLRNRDIRGSLIFLIALPYVRAKAQDYYESLGGGVDADIIGNHVDNPSQQTGDLTQESIVKRLAKTFKAVYPWLNTTFELWLLSYNIAYMFDRTAFYRPWLSWIGIDLRRLGADDLRRMNSAAIRTDSLTPPRNLNASIRDLLLMSPRLLLDSLKVLLPTAIFFVKFLEWWYSPSSPARSVSTSPLGPAVPPPRILLPHPQGLQIDITNYGQCPICHNPITNATALPSGYVFCYRCAHEHIEKYCTCPVTLLPTRIWQMRKVLV